MSPKQIISLTNKERKRQGLPPLNLDPSLSLAAKNRAADMVTTGAFSHTVATTTPGVNNWSFIKNTGYRYRNAGENLAKGQRNAKSVVSQWMDSPTHKQNLMSPTYQDIGVAVMKGKDGKRYVVQYFGRK